ncbi:MULTISPECIES: DUF1648 domain-containing protein [Chryseobacterium]|uniref:Membrane protein n=1 Tax=Chryseobacterium geocarposphaerae TaxID=1416776 RepID=A0ABU1LGF1_9FLAO|nr:MULTISPECIES: DUF1648 domain-containing protein [Chryseobacterium]MDR6405791.1 putative membrane protein [Chryseobacterium geocarposphaerae]MDR6699046.1 putative membrane protein [Chryseobacterium ginsenosidimutans]
MENILLTIFDICNFGLLVFLWWFTVKNYKTLPQTIPVHFDFDGKADNFGSKKYSFLMPVLLAVFYFLFAFVVRSPESTNFPVEITKDNQDAQFLIMGVFIRWLFTLVTLIFLNNQDYMFRYSFDGNAKPRVPMATAIFAVIGSLIVLFIFVGIFK